MKTFCIVCFSFVSVAVVTSSLHSECFQNYRRQIVGINRDYEDALLACYDKDNINRRPAQQLDAQAEVEKYRRTSEEICSSQAACNLVRDLVAFFNCCAKTAEENVHKLFVMQLNASSVALELNDQFDREHKDELRCHLLAKRQYFAESSIVYKKHLNCLHSLTPKPS